MSPVWGTGIARARARDALPTRSLSPLAGLADSHIALRGNEGGAAFGGLELEPALEHDDGSGLAVVAGPSAEAGADPCRIGERAPGVGVALSFGLAFEALAQGFDEGQVVRAEGVGDGPEAALTGGAVAGMDELLDGDGGDKGRHGELAPGGVLADAHGLDVEALVLRVRNSCSIAQRRRYRSATAKASAASATGRVVRSRQCTPSPAGGSTSRTSTRLRTTLFGKPVRTPTVGRARSTAMKRTATSASRAVRPGFAGSLSRARPPSARASARPNSRPPSPRLRF